MNLTELQDEIGRLIGDPNHDRWTRDVLTSRINIIQTNILGYTNAVKVPEELTPVAGTSEVAVDSNTMDIIRVYIQRTNGSWFKLRGFLRDQLDYENPNWQQLEDGEPTAYFWDGTNQEINLVPAPDAANAITNGLKVWEVRKPADLASSTDIPFDSNNAMIPYHMAIAFGVASLCIMDDNTPEAMQKSRFHRSGLMDRPGNFERELKRINARFDSPEDIPARILWMPQGGRLSRGFTRSKSYPLG